MPSGSRAQKRIVAFVHGSGASALRHEDSCSVSARAIAATLEQKKGLAASVDAASKQLSDLAARIQIMEGVQGAGRIAALENEVRALLERVAKVETTNSQKEWKRNLTENKALADIAKFDGHAEGFDDWSFSLRTFLSGQDPHFKGFLKFAEDLDQEPDDSDFMAYATHYNIGTTKVQWMNDQLYHVLANKTKGTPLQQVRNLEDQVDVRGARARGPRSPRIARA